VIADQFRPSGFSRLAFVIPFFLIDVIAKSVLLAWIYNGTRGSLLLVVLTHAAWNTSSIFLPMASTVATQNLGAFAVQIVFEVVVAIVIALFAGQAQLSRTEPKQVQEMAT
jgi:membrane protease YdiL (CAAX protease family)